jgi:ABC-type transport system involved in Fe-S cluster assembly fused permease/ATPase subunit
MLFSADTQHSFTFLLAKAFHLLTVCQVLTIAHRLHTVMHSDRIAVLDAGRVVEFDTPEALQARSDGVFAAMVAAANRSKGAGAGTQEEEESKV